MTLDNLIIIGKNVKNVDLIEKSINDSTEIFLVGSDTTEESLLNHVKEKTYKSVAYFAHYQAPETHSITPDVTYNLASDKDALVNFWNKFDTSTIDYLGCSTLKNEVWKNTLKYLGEKTSKQFRASDDNTGNLKAGGDWVLESDGVNVKDLYFTEEINKWMGLLMIVSYYNARTASGEILPWGVQAVWDGKPPESNIGEGSYAFIIDTGINKLDDFNIEENGWSKDFTEDDEDETFNDTNGHGTHVAGTIAAKVNDKGIIGVAPGAMLISLKVSNTGGSTYSAIYDAVVYAGEVIKRNPLPLDKVVIYMGLDGGYSESLHNLVMGKAANEGIRFSFAAGDTSSDVDALTFASAGDHPNVYTVSAVDKRYLSLIHI